MATELFEKELVKADGRKLWLYSRAPLADAGLQAPSPPGEMRKPTPQRRYHPLRKEWVVYADHRQNRTFLPPPDFNPLAVTVPDKVPTELPDVAFDVAVFENRFPSLVADLPVPSPVAGVPETLGAGGSSEVIVYSKNVKDSLASVGLERATDLMRVWSKRVDFLTRKRGFRVAAPFENKGAECGVTLHHPHAQIYAYGWLPAVVQQNWDAQRKAFAETGRSLIETMIEADQPRRIAENRHAVAWVPYCARYPYEVWVAPRRRVSLLSELSADEIRDLAEMLQLTARKYDALWKRPFPYVLVSYPGDHLPEYGAATHFHFQFYPPLRTQDRLKYLAGCELGAGIFINDKLPEQSAEELRGVQC